MVKIISLVLLVLFSLLFPKYINAEQKNFTTGYDIVYVVQEDGMTHASMNMNFTNTSSRYYASSYTIDLGFLDMQNITAKDANGSITPEIKKTQKGHTVKLNFNNKVVGVNKTLVVNLTFDTKDIAKKQGVIWEIATPGLSHQDNLSKLNILVKVPNSFGRATYTKPILVSPNSKPNEYYFTKNDLKNSGISLAFGKKQILAFALQYYLKNSNIFPVTTHIALPPSTNYQEVALDKIEPKPISIEEDKDGNWLAKYYLHPGEKKNILVQGKTQISNILQKQELSPDSFKEYLAEKQYWDTGHSEIKKLALQLKTPEKIYEYVVKKLSYNFSRVSKAQERLGALAVLQKPSEATCLEFTDLFIALTRAAGIPAREVDGFAYTENPQQKPLSLEQDVLHAWPEYYDEKRKTWIMVDPTWGNTTGGIDYFHTLDFDHFAFVIKGHSSTYPVSPGAYKSNNATKKDIAISFGDIFEYNEHIELKANTPSSVMGGFALAGSVSLKNVGKMQLQPQTVMVTLDGVKSTPQTITFGKIPPFGTKTQPFYFSTPFLTNKKATVTIRLGKKTLTTDVIISPFILFKKSD